MTENKGKAAARWIQQLPKGFEGKAEDFSMTMTLIVRTIASGETNNRPWLGITGLDQNGRFLKAATYGPFADIVKGQIEAKMSPGADLEDEGIVLELTGSFYGREAVEGKRADRQFRFNGFEFVTGPSNELFRERQRAGGAIDEARKLLEKGDIRGAYKAFEKFTCSFASTTEPSLTFGELFETDAEAFVEMTEGDVEANPEAPVLAIDADAAQPTADGPEVIEETPAEEKALAEMNGTRGFQPPAVSQVVRPAGLMSRRLTGRPTGPEAAKLDSASQPTADEPSAQEQQAAEAEAPAEDVVQEAPIRMGMGLGLRRRM